MLLTRTKRLLNKLIGKGIKINNFIAFESKCEELLGVEINQIIDYFSHKYVKPKDKFVISFEDFIDLTQRWADSHLVQEQPYFTNEESNQFLEEQKHEMQAKSRDNLVLKLDKHSEKVQEIFEKYASKDQSEEEKDQIPQLSVKLKHIPEIMDDLSYLTSICIVPFQDHVDGKISKKCSKKAVDELSHYLWKRLHQASVSSLRKSSNKQGIYKHSPDGKQKPKDLSTKSIKSVKSKDPKPDSSKRTVQTKVLKDGKEVTQEIEVSDHENPLVLSTGKSIAFEDEKYNLEKGETKLPYNMFQHYLEDFFSSHPEFVFLDTNNEFDSKFNTSVPFDSQRTSLQVPDSSNNAIKKKLESDIATYEYLLATDQLKDPNEKESAQKLVATLKKQLKEHERRTTQSIKGSQRTTNQLSKEELRERGLKEIFNFYSRQHIPQGVPFEELEVIMKQVDLGEFTSFCKDFEINLPRIEIKRAFNAVSLNHKALEFEGFYKGILRMGVMINDLEVQRLRKKLGIKPKSKNPSRIKKHADKSESGSSESRSDSDGDDSDASKTQTTKMNKKSRKESSGDDSGSGSDDKSEQSKRLKNKSRSTQNRSKMSKRSKKSRKSTHNEGSSSSSSGSDSEDGSSKASKTEITGKSNKKPKKDTTEEDKKRLKLLEAKTNEDLFEEILDFIQCHDANIYRKKIKGFRLAFNIREKTYRMPDSTLLRPNKVRSKQSAEQLKKKVKEMKDNRLRKKQAEEFLKEQKMIKNRQTLKKMHQKMLNRKFEQNPIDVQSSYVKSMMQSKKNTSRHAQVNLGVLKMMHYSDFNLGDEDDFRPEDIIEDDDSDDSILALYENEPKEEIVIPQDKITINNANQIQYDEKVVGLKKSIKKQIGTSRENKKEFLSVKNKANPNKSTIAERYKAGRNLASIRAQDNANSLAYQNGAKRLRHNNSASKVSQSVDRHPLTKRPKNQLANLTSIHGPEVKGTTKNVKTKVLLNPHKRNEVGI